MRLSILLASLGLVAGSTTPLPKPVSDPCADCPDHRLIPDPYQWRDFVALRFFDKGRPIAPAYPFATRTAGDYVLQYPLRFGEIYLVRGNNDRYRRRFPQTIRCICGRDTMTVQFRPYWAETLVFDSIPFRPGRYALLDYGSLQEQREEYRGPGAHGNKQKSFAAYYLQHQADLVKANPFVGCRFLDREVHFTSNPDNYVPAQPTDIFCLLLQHTRYTYVRGFTIRPLAKGENLPMLH